MKTQTKEEPVIDSERGKAGRVLLSAGGEGLRDDLRPAAASKKRDSCRSHDMPRGEASPAQAPQKGRATVC